MNPTTNQTNTTVGGNDALVNLALGGIAVIAAIAGVLYAAGIVTAFLTSAAKPTEGIAGALGVLVHPGDPGTALGAAGLNVIVYWIIATLLLAIATTLGVLAFRLFRQPTANTASSHAGAPGLATRSEVKAAAGPKALLARAARLRPSLTDPSPSNVGYLLGHSNGVEVWASVEDSILVIGPPRSGKGLHLVVNSILDAPGPVISTSTRPDNLHATIKARRGRGPVAVFDPQNLTGLGGGLRWSPIRGCENPQTAMIRANGLAAATGVRGPGVESGGFWEGKTRTALQALLHAAALDGRTPAELFRWTNNAQAAIDAVTILRSHPDAATGWAESLDAMINADPRTRDSIWQGVALSLSALADPSVLAAVSPEAGEQFDPETFLRANGTLYLLATGSGASPCGSLVAAFIEDLVETARRLAARSPGVRLDPPVLLSLDEIANLAPLPCLPTLMAEGGGTGITTMPVLQSMSQARAKWGIDAAGAIWDAAIVKVILGGISAPADLRDTSLLIGERDDQYATTTRTETGGKTLQTTLRRVPVMAPEAIRTLPFGTAITLLRAAKPIITTLRPYTARRDYK